MANFSVGKPVGQRALRRGHGRLIDLRKRHRCCERQIQGGQQGGAGLAQFAQGTLLGKSCSRQCSFCLQAVVERRSPAAFAPQRGLDCLGCQLRDVTPRIQRGLCGLYVGVAAHHAGQCLLQRCIVAEQGGLQQAIRGCTVCAATSEI